MSENNEQATEGAPDIGIDVNDLSVDCMDDPVLVIATRQLVRYENSTLLAQYDAICTDCVSGDKRLPGHQHMAKSGDDVLCKSCGGTGRIQRAPPGE